jgi:quinol monooxygenase YgiN
MWSKAEVFVEKLALLALLTAKPGKEQELAQFLKSAQPLAAAEPGTAAWYAVKLGPNRFGIFDTFLDQSGREAHLNGEIAKALFAKADELLAERPQIEQLEILAVKPLAK